ncbi:Hypothetical protein NTJ_15708 [Nesidiocoris tenuis]|uniref:Uncharacterized protein n=1 Tax=Nesidiocoris tenuis TaxID=355587 RepID=A0ABN7BG77_9HEMI|nr:Hypothetical protein NTJ_15708 [Nesidiocoris tenuis]
MSNADGDNEDFLSDEDMFSPKKRHPSADTVAQTVRSLPGCLHRHVTVFKKLLTGIPPPPDHTNPDFHLDKLLTLWQENQSLVWSGGGNDEASKPSANELSILGMCHNVDSSCEEFESIGSQVCQRYISSETAALTSNVYNKMTQSAKKRRKANGWSQSPQTRVSYLTRRAHTFQKDSMASALATASRKTQILVANDGSRRNSSASKSAVQLKGKRALFLSPENNNKFRTPDEGKNRRLCRQLSLQSSPARNTNDLSSNGKCDHSNHTRSSERKRCSRSLFADRQTSSNADSGSENLPKSTQNEQKIANHSNQLNLLSTPHRKKMLWAVSHALKEVKINMDDPAFKPTLSRLYKATVDLWRTTNPNSDGSADKKRVSTSDAMLASARKLVESITGRALPKFGKKSKTPVKSQRDENNPPSSIESSCAVSISGLSGELGTFPLEHVGVLAEKRVTIAGNTTSSFSNSDLTEENSSMVKLTGKRKRDDASDRGPQIEQTDLPVQSKRSKKTPKKSIPCDSDDEQCYQLLTANGSPSRESRVPTPKRRKLNCDNSESLEPIELTSPRVLRNKTPSKNEDDLGTTETPKRGRSCTKGDVQLSEISSPRVLRNRTPSKPVADVKVRRTPAKNTKAVTPNKCSAAESTEMSSPRLLRSRTPLKTLDVEVRPAKNTKPVTPDKCYDSAQIEEMSSPRVLRSRTPSKSLVDVEVRRTPAKNTKPVTPNKCYNSAQIAEMSSPRVLRSRTPSKTLDAKHTPAKNAKPVTPKKCYADHAALSELSSPQVLRSRTPSKQTPKKLRESPRIPKTISPANCSEPLTSDARTPKKLQTVTECNERLLSPRFRNSARARTGEIPTMKARRCTTAFSPRETDEIIENMNDVTPKKSGTKTFKNHSSTVFADVHADEDMPILKRQSIISRRSSRKLSIDVSPSPPILEWEVDEGNDQISLSAGKSCKSRPSGRQRTPRKTQQF